VRNLVFDFGGVLFRWQPAQLFAQHFPEQANTTARARQMAQAMFQHPDWHAFDSGTATLDHTVARSAERLNLPHAPLRALVGDIGDHLAPMEETVALLRRLHQRRLTQPDGLAPRLYFLSNMPEPYARLLEQKHGFLHCFDGGVFSGDVKLVKPDPAIYAHLEDCYALQPAQTLFIDDLDINIHAAQARGWQGVRFTSAEQLGADLAALGL
jgi:putative hydrolase of the HAD superfamily